MTAPELIPGMSFAEYCDDPSVNVSKLLTYRRVSPAEAHWEQTHPKDDTPSLVKGHASHSAILEPPLFESLYAAMPAFGDCRVPANKEKRNAWIEAHKNSIQLNPDEYEAAVNVRNAVARHPFASTLFSGAGLNELTVKWTDAATELPCKARIDRITILSEGHYRNQQILIDLKTARDIDDYAIQKAIAEYHYHTRLAFYLDALKLVKPAEWRVFLVWALNRPPWVVRVTELEDDSLEEGRRTYRKLLDLHAACVKADNWPGYTNDAPDTLGLPVWAFRLYHPEG